MNSAHPLAGRVVVVTGASRGLGRAIVQDASEAGATVVALARSESGLEETVRQSEGASVHPWIFDIRDVAGFAHLVDQVEETVGAIHGVVHSAGVQLRGAAVDLSPSDLSDVLRVNLDAPLLLSAAIAKRQLERAAEGSHVFLGSLTSTIGVPGVAPYGVSKAGVVGAVRSLAVEWASSGIRVNAVAPGYFETDLTRDVLADPARREAIMRRIPMGRLGDPRDVAMPVTFLLSEAARYITGVVLNVDGGWLAN